MMICPNCSHANPEGAVQCEACYTPLPEMIACPQCGAAVAATAHFCGQCGHDLQENGTKAELSAMPLATEPPPPPAAPMPSQPASNAPEQPKVPTPAPAPGPDFAAPRGENKTQLQQSTARMLHVQSNTVLELPSNLSVIHIGKPNSHIPPDLDVSGFADADVVSRVHADIRVEGEYYYIEDVGSSNGTYINNLPLRKGDRHRLQSGDRIALGKGDKVSFIFLLP